MPKVENSHIKEFGMYGDTTIQSITLLNNHGTRAEILTYGATLHAFCIRDKNGDMHDIVAAPQNLEGYLQQYNEVAYYFGASIGRYAGRIKNGFSLGGKFYRLGEEGEVHLHGGEQGLHNKVWTIEALNTSEAKVVLSCSSEHMEGGYPGNLKVYVHYELSNDNALKVKYEASSDEDTVLNLTNHAYFNLGKQSILNQQLCINSMQRLELDVTQIPTGRFLENKDSAYDFLTKQPLQKITQVDGFDDVFVLDETNDDHPKVVCSSEETGLQMEVFTNQRALVVFTPKRFEGGYPMKNEERADAQFPALCFETQNFPDVPNHSHFPSTVLKKGETYINETVFKVSTLSTQV